MELPKTIYLQWDGDGQGEVTWCVDKINDEDIAYVLEARLTELERACHDLIDYRRRVGALGFQLEKAEDYLLQIKDALGEA